MDIGQIQSGMVGMALFDMWMAGLEKLRGAGKAEGSPLVAAAAGAFEQYIQTQELGFAAQISGAAVYALNPGGDTVRGLTTQDIAPFLALNVMG
jgi:hypothetical protein